MIRSFNLRHLALVRRLSEQGISLDTESVLTDQLHPLRDALFSLVGGDFPTFVWKSKKGAASGFIQLALEGDEHHAHIRFLSAVEDGVEDNGRSWPESVWLHLLDHAVAEVGREGIHSLVVEVDENGPELPILRRAGFAVYTRQDIWRRVDDQPRPADPLTLQLRQSTDEWDIQLLYGNIVPRLVQLVEPDPPATGQSWVLREGGELAAFAHIHNGAAATWLQLFIHPNAQAQVDEIVAAALGKTPTAVDHPVYCCVRRYQSWLQSSIERAGFQLWGSQAVMVKHTVHYTPYKRSRLEQMLEGNKVSISAPIVGRSNQLTKKVNGRSG